MRLLDIGVIDSRPAISYAVWQGETGQAEYKVKLYSRSGWRSPPWSVASGDPFGYEPAIHYLGGMVIGPDDQLYIARKDNHTGVWHVERWYWSTSRETFRLEREPARDFDQPLVRPYVPARTGAVEVIVQRLHRYEGFDRYDTDLLVFF